MKIEEYTIPRVIGVKQAAVEFGISEYSLRAWIKSGQLPVVNCGRKHLINCTILSRFLSGEFMETQVSEQIEPVAVGNDGTLYVKSNVKKCKSKNGNLCKVMPAIK